MAANEAQQPFGDVPGGFRSARSRARVVIVLLALGIGADLSLFISTAYEVGLLTRIRDGGLFSIAEGDASDHRLLVLTISSLVLYAATGLAWLIWQHRAHGNLRALHVSGLQITPRWSVGWWFVPIANLFKPYYAMKELWQASHPGANALGDDWKRFRWPVLGWWWAAWIATVALSRIYRRSPAETPDQFIAADYLFLLGVAVGVGAAVLALLVVRSIDARQTAAATTPVPRPDLADADVVAVTQPGVETMTTSGSRRLVVLGAVIGALTLVLAGTAYVIGRGEAETVSFRDDFSEPGIWLVDSDADGSLGYVGDDYQISVENPTGISTSIFPIQRDRRLEAVRVEVEAETSGTTGVLGVSCMTDQGSLASYDFLLFTDLSWYAIFKADSDGASGRVLVEREEPSPNRSGGTHRIRGDCISGDAEGGTSLVMFVNGKQVLEHRDPEGYDGFQGIGLYVESFEGGTVVRFDNAVMESL